jgi:hypothetical protein
MADSKKIDPAPDPAPDPPVVPDGWPGWLADILRDLHERLVKLGG